MRKRCVLCRKRAKDIIEDEPLCRIHSPKREGYSTRIAEEESKLRKKKK